MNTPNEIRIDNPQFLKKQPSVYNCFIVLGKSYLSYALLDQANATVFAVKHFDYKHQVIGKSDFDHIFSDKYIQKATRYYLAVNTQKRTLVPAALYDDTKKENYIQHQFEIGQEESLHDMHIANEFVSIFALKNDSVNYFKSRLTKVSFYDASACVLKTYPKHFSSGKKIQCFISISAESTTLSIYLTQKLILHKSYSSATENDIIYHTLNALQQLELQPQDTHFHLHGENMELAVKVFDLLDGRVGELSYINRPHEIAFPEDLYAKPPHYFFNLFSLVLCVS